MPGYDSGCCFRSSADGRVRVVWEVTTRCNLDCGFCHARPHSLTGPRTSDVFAGLSLLARWGTRGVIFTGGEPLVRDDCVDLLTAASDAGLETDLCTNATLVDAVLAKRLARVLAEVSVSLDSADAGVHDRLRGRAGAWRSAVRGIEHLVSAGIEAHAIVFACDETVPGMEQTLALLAGLGVHSVTLLGPVAMPGDARRVRLDPANRTALVQSLPYLRERAGEMHVNTKRVTSVATPGECPAGSGIWGIGADGSLLTCILRKGAEDGMLLQELRDRGAWDEVRRRSGGADDGTGCRS